MLNFAFRYFKLDYKDFIKVKKTSLNKNEVEDKKTNHLQCLRKNKIRMSYKIYGKLLIIKMIKFYINEKKI